MGPEWIRNKDVLVFVYDITKPDDLPKLEEFLELAGATYTEKVPPYIFVGNQMDKLEHGEPEVTDDMIRAFAEKYRSEGDRVGYLRTSAWKGEGIESLLDYIMAHGIEYLQEATKKKSTERCIVC